MRAPDFESLKRRISGEILLLVVEGQEHAKDLLSSQTTATRDAPIALMAGVSRLLVYDDENTYIFGRGAFIVNNAIARGALFATPLRLADAFLALSGVGVSDVD